MTDHDPKQPMEFDDLEPLPAEAELQELPEEVVELDALPEIEELEPLPAEPEPAPKPEPAPVPATTPTAQGVAPAKPEAAPAKTSPGPGAVKASTGSRRERMEKDREARKAKPKVKTWDRWPGPGEKPKREMEKAPALLRKASYGLYIGCLLPWGTPTDAWWQNIVEKLLVLFGLYVWHQAHLLRDGAKVPGFIAKLGAKQFLPLFVLAGVSLLVGFLPTFSFGSLFLEGGGVDSGAFGPFAEKGFLILAGLSITHIYDYEHGGRFNPLYPLMFLAPGIAGVMALLKVFSADPIGFGHILGGLGAILVGAAGWMSAYTMYVAMKEAKAHGEAKKAAQAEARKAARAARKT